MNSVGCISVMAVRSGPVQHALQNNITVKHNSVVPSGHSLDCERLVPVSIATRHGQHAVPVNTKTTFGLFEVRGGKVTVKVSVLKDVLTLSALATDGWVGGGSC